MLSDAQREQRRAAGRASWEAFVARVGEEKALEIVRERASRAGSLGGRPTRAAVVAREWAEEPWDYWRGGEQEGEANKPPPRRFHN